MEPLPEGGPGQPLPRPNEAVADLHRHLLKELQPGRPQSSAPGQRSLSASASSSTRFADPEGAGEAARLKTPGGFRRHYLQEQARQAGVEEDKLPESLRQSFMESIRPLIHVGYFDSVMGIRLDPETGQDLPPAEGRSGTFQTSVAIVKSFVGSGITYMPGAMAHGGWAFSLTFLLIIAAVNAICVRLLVDCQVRCRCSSYGEIAKVAAGRVGALAVQVSIVLSQFGYCVAYIIFSLQLVRSLGPRDAPMVLIGMVPVLIPLCLIRSVESLEYPNLIADILIFFGLMVVLVYNACMMVGDEVASDVKPFKPHSYGIFIGTAVYTFEGIPLILPIRSAMREPDKFLPLFSKLFFFIAIFFAVFGLLGYMTYGEGSEMVVLLNLPQRSPLTSVVKVGYMLALVFGMPLMFLPAARITERWVLGVVDRGKGRDEQQVNLLRIAEVLCFCAIAYKGEACFDLFLAFTGALCCAPIAFIYPSYFHLQLCAKSFGEKFLDISLLLLGVGAMVFTLISLL